MLNASGSVFKQAGGDKWRTTTIPHHFSVGHEEEQQTHLPVEQGIAGAAPVVPAIFYHLSDTREPANPADLGSAEARRNTGVSDHFHSLVR